MSKPVPDTKLPAGQADFTKPGTPCSPSVMPEINNVVTINVKDVHGLVLREVSAVLASLPFYQVTCITVQRAAELLDCYEDTVRVYIRNGQLPASRLGKDYRIRIVDLQKFLQQKLTRPAVVKSITHRKKVC